MIVRNAFYKWLPLAVVLLPVWMFLSWIIFDRSGWSFILVAFVAVPSVLVAGAVTWLLVRARPSVQYTRESSWLDVGATGLWQALTIWFGFAWGSIWQPWIMTGAIIAFFGAVWVGLSQLWDESRAGWSWRNPPASKQANTEPIILLETPNVSE